MHDSQEASADQHLPANELSPLLSEYQHNVLQSHNFGFSSKVLQNQSNLKPNMTVECEIGQKERASELTVKEEPPNDNGQNEDVYGIESV